MITKFNTPPMGSGSTGGSTSGGSDKLVYLAIALVGIYVVYRFIIKPEMDKKITINESTDDTSFE